MTTMLGAFYPTKRHRITSQRRLGDPSTRVCPWQWERVERTMRASCREGRENLDGYGNGARSLLLVQYCVVIRSNN